MNARYISLAILLILTLMRPVMALELSDFKWKNRVILVQAAAYDDPAATAQRAALFQEPQALALRHLVVIEHYGNGILYQNGQRLYGERLTRNQAAIAPLDMGRSGDDFHIALFGKDGGLKDQSDSVIDPSRFFALIDTMPMRRNEMRANR